MNLMKTIRELEVVRLTYERRKFTLTVVDRLLGLGFDGREALDCYLDEWAKAKRKGDKKSQYEIIGCLCELVWPKEFIGKLRMGPMPKWKKKA